MKRNNNSKIGSNHMIPSKVLTMIELSMLASKGTISGREWYPNQLNINL